LASDEPELPPEPRRLLIPKAELDWAVDWLAWFWRVTSGSAFWSELPVVLAFCDANRSCNTCCTFAAEALWPDLQVKNTHYDLLEVGHRRFTPV
jgi:hypothetical protein